MLDDLLDFLPPELDAAEVREHALIPRSFDRPTGQLLFVARGDGRRALLSRPNAFELFREIPVRSNAPFALVQDEYGARLEVHVVDGRVLRLPLLEDEVAQVDGLLVSARARRSSRPEMAPRSARDSRSGRRGSLRPPESVEAEVVVVPDHLLKKDGTPVPEPIRGDGAVEDLARKILMGAQQGAAAPPRPSPPPSPRPSPRPKAPSTPRSSPRPGVQTSSAHDSDRPSAIPPALAPSREALARVRGETEPDGERESVRPPAFTPEPMPAVVSPRDTTALRTRLKQHWERGELDEASQVARVLAFLGSVDPTEKRLASLAGDQSPVLSTPLASHLFKAYVAHDDEDPDVARVCASLWPALLTMRLRPERDLGLRARDQVDVTTAEAGFGGVFRRAARALGLPVPRLWLRADLPGGLAYLNVSPIGSLAGGSIASSFSYDEMLFVAGHHLAFYRPESYLLALLPSPSDLLTLVCAGLYLERRMPADPRIVKVADTIERFMVPQVRESLRLACADLSLPTVGDPRTHLSDALLRFRRASNLSAVRAGFALTGSIAVAARMVRLLPVPHGLTAEDLVDDLASYAVSRAWLTLRRELGIALAPSAPEIPI